jgi:glycosyltransferase involved in cell wall biosynthesis
MKSATCLIFPSECYEGVSMSLLEAMAVGLPAVASDLGSMPHVVEDGKTGLLFKPGEPRELAAKVVSFLADAETVKAMRMESRRRYLERYSAGAHYDAMLTIYQAVHSR